MIESDPMYKFQSYCLFLLIHSYFEHIGVIFIRFYTHCTFGSNNGDILFNRDG